MAALLLFVCSTARANPIIGNFSIAGSDTFDASQITFTNQAHVQSTTLPGVYGENNNPNDPNGNLPTNFYNVALTSFAYADADGTQLFTFTQNGTTVSFVIYQYAKTYIPFAAATASTLQVSKSLKIDGYGNLSETGYDSTSASFSLTSSESGAISFQAVGDSPAYPSIPGVAPEPSSLLLLGTGMLSVSGMLIRRRRVQSL